MFQILGSTPYLGPPKALNILMMVKIEAIIYYIAIYLDWEQKVENEMIRGVQRSTKNSYLVFLYSVFINSNLEQLANLREFKFTTISILFVLVTNGISTVILKERTIQG